MFTRWILSSFFTDDSGGLVPVCAAYGGTWHCPTFPSDATGKALVLMYVDIGGLGAAAPDSRVIVCPDVSDGEANVPPDVLSAYAAPSGGATGGGPAKTIPTLQVLNSTTDYSMAAVITALAAAEPAFLHVIPTT